ncbi:uncharacterized protein [Procambarus clarkii]|uniref:uncharacterized protein n=1 Tax=Procambarus clarkii TaxID=6728 RepID=UPI001E67332B|nr:uncharacterized protein LOC123749006 isoform X1 [Procambarus clarkii]XP_045588021.1 uncharacterized protein LOC123749944 [Procambarus clarkii]XP_045589521.1 uncharacterized protein LOC123751481 [Procambarus clarkii]XP_045598724.1 uncharacterized protein LOC123758403 [Procambarus clarkii]XP_045612765.1 uncharacterized protein LOC123767238 [Procambarus clarkii]
MLTYLRGCGYESIVIYYKKGPARVTHGILPNNVIQEEDKKIFTTNFFLSRTRKLDADKLTLGSEGDSDNALEKNPDELQVQQVHKVQKVPQVQEIQQLQKVPQVEHLQKVPPVQQGLPLAILQKQQEVQVVKFEPQGTTPGKQCSNNGMGILKYLRKQVKKDKQ